MPSCIFTTKPKELLHCAIFRATCLATPFLQTFSHYETSCFTSVTLNNVSCNLPRFDDHMRLKERFHWLVPRQMLHCAMLKKIDATVAESRTEFYFLQRFLQTALATCLAVARFVTLGNDSCNLSRNVLATLWRDKLHETFHSVKYPAKAKIVARKVARAVAESRIKFYFSCNLSCSDFGRCRACYTVKCFVQLVPPQCR